MSTKTVLGVREFLRQGLGLEKVIEFNKNDRQQMDVSRNNEWYVGYRRATPCYRTFCDDGDALTSADRISHLWLGSTWNVSSVAEEMYF